jgi:purine-binding chemotaxis protein CheW
MEVKQFVTFKIDEHLLGINILLVREINRILDITDVPASRNFVRGLLNLRGQIITVIDLGVRLGRLPRKVTDESHNIILKADNAGLLVDSIGDVVRANENEIDQPPSNTGGIEERLISGVVKLKDGLMIILNINSLLNHL